MKRWSIFGAAAPEAKDNAPRTPPPGGFEWSAMFHIRKKRDGRARTDAEESAVE